jgi:hypothetical protein
VTTTNSCPAVSVGRNASSRPIAIGAARFGTGTALREYRLFMPADPVSAPNSRTETTWPWKSHW